MNENLQKTLQSLIVTQKKKGTNNRITNNNTALNISSYANN